MAEEGELAVEFDFDDDAEGMDMDEDVATLQQEREKHRQRCASGIASRECSPQHPGVPAHEPVETGSFGDLMPQHRRTSPAAQ